MHENYINTIILSTFVKIGKIMYVQEKLQYPFYMDPELYKWVYLKLLNTMLVTLIVNYTYLMCP